MWREGLLVLLILALGVVLTIIALAQIALPARDLVQ
jgi:ABC-type nickel/cobalt efflux system permease component RcnA